MAEVKFCGLTRAADAAHGAALDARYLGVIFAGGVRQRSPGEAREVLNGAANRSAVLRVGVFGSQTAEEVAAIAAGVALDVVQLHGASEPAMVDAVRRRFAGEVWRVVRVRDASHLAPLRDAAVGVDAVVIDALVAGALGGTGVAVDWEAVARVLDLHGRPARLVLAGGLRSDNVERALSVLSPDVVDVSSGVESAPGIKDHEMMRAFADAVARGGR